MYVCVHSTVKTTQFIYTRGRPNIEVVVRPQLLKLIKRNTQQLVAKSAHLRSSSFQEYAWEACLCRKFLKFICFEIASGMVFTSDFLQYQCAPYQYNIVFTQQHYYHHDQSINHNRHNKSIVADNSVPLTIMLPTESFIKLDAIYQKFSVAIFAGEAILVVGVCHSFMASQSKVLILLHMLHLSYKTNFLNSHRDGQAQGFLIFFLQPVIAAITQL